MPVEGMIVDVLSQSGNYPETSVFYRRRAFEPEVSVGAMLWRAFDKTV